VKNEFAGLENARDGTVTDKGGRAFASHGHLPLPQTFTLRKIQSHTIDTPDKCHGRLFFLLALIPTLTLTHNPKTITLTQTVALTLALL